MARNKRKNQHQLAVLNVLPPCRFFLYPSTLSLPPLSAMAGAAASGAAQKGMAAIFNNSTMAGRRNRRSSEAKREG